MICLGAMEGTTGWISGLALSPLVLLAPVGLLTTPFAVAPLHFRLAGAEGVELALATGLLSWVLDSALITTLRLVLCSQMGGPI